MSDDNEIKEYVLIDGTSGTVEFTGTEDEAREYTNRLNDLRRYALFEKDTVYDGLLGDEVLLEPQQCRAD